jgi:amidase
LDISRPRKVDMGLQHELADTTVADLAYRIRRRDLSPVEVVDATIEAIEADNDRLNAFVHLGFDEARERARAAERAVTSAEPLGPLHGRPSGACAR